MELPCFAATLSQAERSASPRSSPVKETVSDALLPSGLGCGDGLDAPSP